MTSSDRTGHEEKHSRNERAIPLLAIAQGTAAIGGMLIKGIMLWSMQKERILLIML